MTVVEILTAVCLVLGTVLLLAAAVGVVRFPDFYSRLHAAGKGDTLGQALVTLGVMISSGLTLVSLKLAFIVFFIFILNPTATHALARGAWVCGVRPWLGGREEPFRQREGQITDAEREALLVAETTADEGDAPAGRGEEGAWTS